MTKANKNISQITVGETSAILGLSERSVLNHIKSKEIEAIKVGKKWFVSQASAEAFLQRHRFYGKGLAVKPKDIKDGKREDDYELRRSDNQTLASLRCYKLCRKAFQMPKWNPLQIDDTTLSERLLVLKLKAIESLGCGFYAFRSGTKSQWYETSRSAVGGIVALLHSGDDVFSDQWQEELEFLEQELLPAYSSLIRKIEKRKL